MAEDNEINALLTRALLQKLGHRPQVVASGHAAMESFLAANGAGLPFDLILMDVRMSGIDGIEATRRIRAIEGQCRAIRRSWRSPPMRCRSIARPASPPAWMRSCRSRSTARNSPAVLAEVRGMAQKAA